MIDNRSAGRAGKWAIAAAAVSTRRLIGAVYMIAVMLAGCVNQPQTTDAQGGGLVPKSHAKWLAAGKATLLTEGGVRHNFRLWWQRTAPNADHVVLSGPLGFGSVELDRFEGAVTWRKDEQNLPLSYLNLDTEMSSTLQSLPFAQLGGWLLGHHSEDVDWHSEVIRWQSQGMWQLPRKLKISKRSKDTPIEVTLVVFDWEIQ